MRSKNSFINRYMANLENSDTKLQPTSPSRINSVNNSPITKLNIQISDLSDDKENISYMTPKRTKTEGPVLGQNLQRTSSLSPSKTLCSSSSLMNLPKNSSPSQLFDVSTLSRKDAKYYEFLCRITEAKNWMEEIIGEQLPSEIDLVAGNAMRDGVILAKLTQKMSPGLVKKIVPPGNSLQYTHTQNINSFFALVENVGVPDNFRFELTDLYDKKDIAKVFETIHALANIINKKWPGRISEIQNLSGLISPSPENIKICQRKLPAIHDFRSFKSEYSPSASPSKPNSQGLIDDFTSETVIPDKQATTIEKNEKVGPNLVSPPEIPQTPTKEDVPNLSFPHVLNTSLIDIRRLPDRSSPSRTPIDLSLTQIPQLDFNHIYSPSKSFSYYSPTISRHLSYKTDEFNFYSRRRFEQDDDSDHYDTFRYTKISYSPMRKRRMAEVDFLDAVTEIQAICRGVNCRFDLLMKERKLALIVDLLPLFQARLRGNLMKKSISAKLKSLESEALYPQISKFQSLVKGVRVRRRLFNIKIGLLKVELSLFNVQNLCRGIATNRKYKQVLTNYNITNPLFQTLQAYAKGKLLRMIINSKCNTIASYSNEIIMIQAFARGFILRKNRQSKLNLINKECASLVNLQSVLRAKIFRKKKAELDLELEHFEPNRRAFLAILRGTYGRLGINSLVTAVRDSKDPVVSFQALTKGVLTRYALELIADYVESSEIAEFQCLCKGFLQRRKLEVMQAYYERNASDIIKIQSHFRSAQMRWAYLEFMSSGNPSLWSVRRFVHLVNELHVSHESESKLEDLKSLIDQSNKDFDKKQSKVDLFKSKINLLRENHFQISLNLSDADDTLALESDATGTLSVFEKLFYLLQTDTFYWKALFRVEPSFSLKYVTKSFLSTNGMMGRRENVFFIKLISDLIAADIEERHDIKSFLVNDQVCVWSELVHYYLLHQIPELMVELFQPVLDYITRPDIDFEAVPSNIYRNLHPERPEVTSSEAIEDMETKSKFINNLTCMWGAVELVSEALSRNYSRIPEDIKYLCTKAYKAVADRSSEESDALLAISRILIEEFVCYFFENPTKFGVQKLGLASAGKVSIFIESLITVFSFDDFQGYMTPLNQYVDQIRGDIAISLKSMLTSPEFENHCDKLIYFDMSQGIRPLLNIPKQYLLDIVNKLQCCSESFPHDDEIHVLFKLLKKGDCQSKIMKDKRNIIILKLNPSAYKLSSSDDRVSSIYNEVKRGLSYMMQIEDIETNLYDLLTSSVIPSDEPVFQNFLKSSAAIRSDPLFKGLKSLTYFDLKEHVLERSYELKQMGALNIDDHCQGLLNDIANTIKSRKFVVKSITNEVDVAEATLKKLDAKNRSLQNQLQLLEKSVMQSVKTVQRSNNYLPMKKNGFGTKLKDAYRKVHNKSSGSSNCLSLDWSARRLYELEVLVDITGENLGKVAVKFFGSSGPKFPEVYFKISTSDGEMFGVEMIDERKNDKKFKGNNIDSFTFRKLLEILAHNQHAQLTFFSAQAKFNAYHLFQLIIEMFYKR